MKDLVLLLDKLGLAGMKMQLEIMNLNEPHSSYLWDIKEAFRSRV
jgi:hypothetical protein